MIVIYTNIESLTIEHLNEEFCKILRAKRQAKTTLYKKALQFILNKYEKEIDRRAELLPIEIVMVLINKGNAFTLKERSL